MELTDTISAMIFTLIVMAVLVYVGMSRYVIGPPAELKKAERVMLGVMLAGTALVILYAATELLFHVVF